MLYHSHTINKSNYKLLKSKQIGGKVKKQIIYFVRHGETQWNIEKRSQGGEADIPLNIGGETQAYITGLYFNQYIAKNHTIDIIFTSPAKRASQTAKIIAKTISESPKIETVVWMI